MDTTRANILPTTAALFGAVLEFFSSLSPEARYQRFFSHRNLRRDEANLLTEQSEDRRCVAAVADGVVLAHGVLTRDPVDRIRGELGIVVTDAWQRRRIGYSMAMELLLGAQTD